MIRKICNVTVLVIGLFLVTSVLPAQNTERHDPTAGMMMMERFGNQAWMGVSVAT